MSYGNRRYGDHYGRSHDYYQSPWDSGRAPEKYGDRYGSGGTRYPDSRHGGVVDPSAQLAAANAILSAVLQTQQRGSYVRDRRDQYRTSSRPNFRSRAVRRSRGVIRSPRSRTSRSREEKKPQKEKESKNEETKETDEASTKSDDKKETLKKEEKPKDDNWKQYKYRCHLCWKHMDNEEQHLAHLKTEEHETKLEERRARYRRQIQAIVFKLRRQEEIAERRPHSGRKGFCTVCNVNFYGMSIRHNKTGLHKDMRNLKQAYCRFCDLRFGDRVDYDKHILTLKHLKIRATKMEEEEDLKSGNAEVVEPTGDDDELEKLVHPEDWDSELAIGMHCVRKIVGYFCKLCCKFFTEEEQTLDAHCKGEQHYTSFVEFAKTKKEELAKVKEEKAKEEAEKAKDLAEDTDVTMKEEPEAVDTVEAEASDTAEDAEGDNTAVEAEEEMVETVEEPEEEMEQTEEKADDVEEEEPEEEKQEESEEEEKEEVKETTPPRRGRAKPRGRGRQSK